MRRRRGQVPNYNKLLEKTDDKDLEKGELYPQSSPMMEPWEIENDDAESHENLKTLLLRQVG